MAEIMEPKADYSNLPNFKYLLARLDTNMTREIIHKIENIRYRMYLISYFMNECVEISEINSKYDTECVESARKILNAESGSRSEITNIDQLIIIVQNIYKKVNDDLNKLFDEHFNQFVENNQDFCKNDGGNIYPKDILLQYILINRWFEWERIYHRKFYNEAENPTIISMLLNYLFKQDSDKDCKYCVDIYDFHDWTVYFKDKVTMEDFCDNHVECGTTFTRPSDSEAWMEYYSF